METATKGSTSTDSASKRATVFQRRRGLTTQEKADITEPLQYSSDHYDTPWCVWPVYWPFKAL